MLPEAICFSALYGILLFLMNVVSSDEETKTKSKAKPQKSTNSKESMNIDSCNIIHKKRRN